MEELNRSVHTWIEESEHSGANSDDGMSSPSAAGAQLRHPSSPDRGLPFSWAHCAHSRSRFLPMAAANAAAALSAAAASRPYVLIRSSAAHLQFCDRLPVFTVQACRRRPAALLQGRTARRRP